MAAATPPQPAASQAAPAGRQSHQDWPTGHYKVVEGWPKPLPDTRHSHDGWTWGSFGGVYAESPDRIWIAMRGELPLPAGRGAVDAVRGAESVARQRHRQRRRHLARRASRSRSADGSGGSSTRSSIVDGQGNLVDEWPHLDEMFSKLPCGRGPHQIKISPYDPEKHVWIIDDQLHMIYRFTYDGKLVHSKGELGVRGRGPNTFDRPTDIAWLPDGTYFITDGYGGTRVAKYDANDNFIKDWGQAPTDPKNPGPNEFNTVHSIAISADRRLFVVDRGHQRMQVFDEDGKFLDMWPLRSPHWPASQGTLMVNHFIDDKGLHLGRRRAHEPDPEVRSERQLPLQLGRAGRAAGAARLLARHDDRSTREPVPGRLLRGARAEVRADSRRRSREDRGADPADLGHLEGQIREFSTCPSYRSSAPSSSSPCSEQDTRRSRRTRPTSVFSSPAPARETAPILVASPEPTPSASGSPPRWAPAARPGAPT